ncbi:MAG TPA: alpha/beta hydrolase [Immundisolibacter sp.]|nr:alpha/beta hydrolase [Immundisolibacter sp.]
MHNDVTTTLARPLSGQVHPQVAAHLAQMASMNPPPIEALTAEQVRVGFGMQMKMTAGPATPLPVVHELTLPGPGGAIKARLYRPAADGVLPGLVFFHGGGWVIGDLDSHDDLCRDLAAQAHCAVLAVDYRLAPEHCFPAAAEDAIAAADWAAANAAQLGIDPARLAVGGDSAGGNLAAMVALAARDAGRPLAAQLLIYPVTDMSRLEGESYAACAEGYGLTAGAMAWFRDHYLVNADAARDWRVSPLLASDLSRLPPALVITAEFDVLRSEGEAYAKRLAEAGVPTRLARYDGMIHGFASMAGVLDVGRQVRSDMAQWLRATLGG